MRKEGNRLYAIRAGIALAMNSSGITVPIILTGSRNGYLFFSEQKADASPSGDDAGEALTDVNLTGSWRGIDHLMLQGLLA